MAVLLLLAALGLHGFHHPACEGRPASRVGSFAVQPFAARPARPRACVRAGVAGLQTWMRQRFPDAFEPIATTDVGEFDCVYLDINEQIHHVVRRATSHEDLIKLVLHRVSDLLRSTPPRKLVVLAVDGPGPLAKVLTQRTRRRKTAAKNERVGSRSAAVDTLALTPGTSLMLELSDALEAFAERRVSIARTRSDAPDRHASYIVSGAHVAGEGEVKCLSHLLELSRVQPARVGRPDTHVLHGSDSDLLLLALAAGERSISVLAPVRTSSPAGAGRVRAKAKVRFELFSADACIAALAHMLPADGPTGRRALDLVCLAVLASGNDYMPALQSAKLDSAFDLFAKLAHGAAAPLHLVRLETKTAGAEGGVAAGPGGARVERAALGKLLRTMHERRALRAPPGAPSAGDLGEAAERASSAELCVAEDYVRALDWVLSMCVRGECPDFGLCPVAVPALPALYAVLASPHASAAAAAAVGAPVRTPLVRPPVPAVYNLLVQPGTLATVVPLPLRPLLLADSPIGWLYTQGCTCAECARLYGLMLPLMREVALLAPLRERESEALAQFDAVQAELRVLAAAEKAHLDLAHCGNRMMYNELPAVELVERLVAEVPAGSLSAQERRTLALGEPRRIGLAQPQKPAGMARARAPRVMPAPSRGPPRAAPLGADPQHRPQKPAGASAGAPRSGRAGQAAP
ncbi:XRN 5'-3' exonuclease N-terminus-domain-containing protein [Pavlovales sp. CCMP2436]|nr:XRN 5'-3' exonuclease N-terminus-domain-containing protein [Pavlovales sp. CCMP2436]